MSSPRIAVVNGANRGLGQAICEKFLQDPSIQPIILYACSRSGDPISFNTNTSHGSEIRFAKCDQTDDLQLDKLVAEIRSSETKVDYVVINAGLGIKIENSDHVKKTFDVNFNGAVSMALKFLPIMSKGGRIAFTGAAASQTMRLRAPVEGKVFRPDLTLSDLTQIMNQYIEGWPNPPAGWPPEGEGFNPVYAMSKLALNVAVKILAKSNPQVLINVACPGACKTRMLEENGLLDPEICKTVEEGASIIYHIAAEDVDGISGEFFANAGYLDTGRGQVQRQWYMSGIREHGAER